MIGNWKPAIYRSPKYLAFIRTLPCVLGCEGSEAHHLPKKGDAGRSIKCSDTRSIPFCNLHHIEYHTIGRASFEEKHHIDLREVLINTMEKFIVKTLKLEE